MLNAAVLLQFKSRSSFLVNLNCFKCACGAVVVVAVVAFEYVLYVLFLQFIFDLLEKSTATDHIEMKATKNE